MQRLSNLRGTGTPGKQDRERIILGKAGFEQTAGQKRDLQVLESYQGLESSPLVESHLTSKAPGKSHDMVLPKLQTRQRRQSWTDLATSQAKSPSLQESKTERCRHQRREETQQGHGTRRTASFPVQGSSGSEHTKLQNSGRADGSSLTLCNPRRCFNISFSAGVSSPISSTTTGATGGGFKIVCGGKGSDCPMI